MPAANDFEPSSRRQSVSIVVPTFREAANIPALAERVHAALAGSGIEWELLFADDDSGDGSEAVVAELARRLPVRMETRRDPPRDLSLSVLFGIALALELDPRNRTSRQNMAELRRRQGRPEEALASFARALSLDPNLESARAGAEQLRKTLRERGE